MATITAKYNGRCNCGAAVKAGDRVKWTRAAGIMVCKACTTKVLKRETVTLHGVRLRVVVRGRDGVATKVGVEVHTMELTGTGCIWLRPDGALIGIGATNALTRGDLADYIGLARQAVVAVFQPVEDDACIYCTDKPSPACRCQAA